MLTSVIYINVGLYVYVCDGMYVFFKFSFYTVSERKKAQRGMVRIQGVTVENTGTVGKESSEALYPTTRKRWET